MEKHIKNFLDLLVQAADQDPDFDPERIWEENAMNFDLGESERKSFEDSFKRISGEDYGAWGYVNITNKEGDGGYFIPKEFQEEVERMMSEQEKRAYQAFTNLSRVMARFTESVVNPVAFKILREGAVKQLENDFLYGEGNWDIEYKDGKWETYVKPLREPEGWLPKYYIPNNFFPVVDCSDIKWGKVFLLILSVFALITFAFFYFLIDF